MSQGPENLSAFTDLPVGGFEFQVGDGRRLQYQSRRVLLEGHVGELTLHDAGGHRIWKQEVANIVLPVYPFVCESKYIAFIGATGPEPELHILALESGGLLGRLVPDSDVLLNENSYSEFPFYHKGWIYIEGSAEVDASRATGDRAKRRLQFARYPRVFAVKVAFQTRE